MDKKIRNAVRTYLIKDNQVVVIKYTTHDLGYYDIPGGKIEDGETKEATSIREFKEETGITILKEHIIGHSVVEYPDKIYNFTVFMVDEYLGEPSSFINNDAMWIDINDLLEEDKIFASIKAIKYLKDGMDIKIDCDSNHNIINIRSN